MIELRGESDEEFEYFLSFISRHPIFMLKPLDMGDAHGVERIDSNDFRINMLCIKNTDSG